MRTGHLPGSIEAKETGVASVLEPVFSRENGGYSSVDLVMGGGCWEDDRFCMCEYSGDVGD
jgi:hypothetical protein